MRVGVVVGLSLLGACTPGRRELAPGGYIDADVDAYVEPPYVSNRQATTALLGTTRVAWSMSDPPCPVGFVADCAQREGTVFEADLTSAVPEALAYTLAGVRIAGNENELFYVNADDYEQSYVVRVRPGGPALALSIPRLGTEMVGVDDTYVYWKEPGVNGAPTAVRRATRAGDGSDAVTLQSTTGGYIFGGYFWNIDYYVNPYELRRTPIAGATAELMASGAGAILGSTSDRLFFSESDGTQFAHYRIDSIAADGTITPLTTFLDSEPGAIVVAGNEMFWSTTVQGWIFRAPLTGGSPVQLPTIPDFYFGPFVVTDTQIIYGFTGMGYLTAPR